jgi:hypothetical protein
MKPRHVCEDSDEEMRSRTSLSQLHRPENRSSAAAARRVLFILYVRLEF